MRDRFIARAEVHLAATAEGGLRDPQPSGTRSLILRFDRSPAFDIGAAISTPDGVSLAPGSSHPLVDLSFWADEAGKIVMPGQEFHLWYGRSVGRGLILDVAWVSSV